MVRWRFEWMNTACERASEEEEEEEVLLTAYNKWQKVGGGGKWGAACERASERDLY